MKKGYREGVKEGNKEGKNKLIMNGSIVIHTHMGQEIEWWLLEEVSSFSSLT